MILRVSDAIAHTMLDAIRNGIDAGAGAGVIKVYTASQPAGPGTAISSQTLLGTLTFTDPSAAGASSRTSSYSAITEDSSADASGTIAWCRVLDSNGVAVFDGDASVTGGGGFFQFNTLSVTAGGPIRMTGTRTITVPVTIS